jgi:aryl-alcohol dehydrogenase-like predicted oxidoreductase
MEYRTLGRTGVKVSTHCLGAMMFGTWGNTDEQECIRIIDRALDAGINFIDTADVYSEGVSEEIVGKALAGKRDQVVLATKVHGAMGQGLNEQGNSRLWIQREVENSLRRLQTDHIDLYQIHRPDFDTDIDETLGALTDLVHQGKVRYLGSSTFPAFHEVEAQWASEKRDLERFVCEQPPYSIFVRSVERELFPVTIRYGMGVIVWSPLAGGWLAGKYRRGQAAPADSRGARWKGVRPVFDRYDVENPANERKLDLVEDLERVAEKAGLSLIHMSLAWTLEHPAVTSAIIGPRTMEQFEDLLGAADLHLDEATLDAIDDLVPPGTHVADADLGWTPPWMEPQARRRS